MGAFDDLIPASQSAIPGAFDDLIPAKPAGGLAAAAKQAIGAGIKGAGRAAADFIPGVTPANPISQYGQEVIDANPTAVQSFGDIAESPWTAVKEAVGNSGGSMAGMLGARALGTGITMAAPFTGPAAPLVGLAGQAIANVGPFVAAALPSYGGIREEQIKADQANEADAKSKAIAMLGAGAVGAIEGAYGPQAWALAAAKKGGIEALVKRFAEAKSIPAAIGKGIMRGGAIEGAEELVQNPIEQVASYQDPTTRQAIGETLFGGAMGAIGGGVMGGGMGGFAKSIAPAQTPPPNAAGQTQPPSTTVPPSTAAPASGAPTVDPVGDPTGTLNNPQAGALSRVAATGEISGVNEAKRQEQAIATQIAGTTIPKGVVNETAQAAQDQAGQAIAAPIPPVPTGLASAANIPSVPASAAQQRVDVPGQPDLQRNGFTQNAATPAESALIQRRVQAQSALSQDYQPIIEPSLPNELTLPEKKVGTGVAPAADRSAGLIARAKANAGSRIKGDRLINANGKTLAGNLTPQEITALTPHVKASPQGQQPNASQTEVTVPPTPGRSAQPAQVPGAGVTPALQYPSQPMTGGMALEQQPAPMSLGEYGKSKTAASQPAAPPKQSPAKPVSERLQSLVAKSDDAKLAGMAQHKNAAIREAAVAEIARREADSGKPEKPEKTGNINEINSHVGTKIATGSDSEQRAATDKESLTVQSPGAPEIAEPTVVAHETATDETQAPLSSLGETQSVSKNTAGTESVNSSQSHESEGTGTKVVQSTTLPAVPTNTAFSTAAEAVENARAKLRYMRDNADTDESASKANDLIRDVGKAASGDFPAMKRVDMAARNRANDSIRPELVSVLRAGVPLLQQSAVDAVRRMQAPGSTADPVLSVSAAVKEMVAAWGAGDTQADAPQAPLSRDDATQAHDNKSGQTPAMASQQASTAPLSDIEKRKAELLEKRKRTDSAAGRLAAASGVGQQGKAAAVEALGARLAAARPDTHGPVSSVADAAGRLNDAAGKSVSERRAQLAAIRSRFVGGMEARREQAEAQHIEGKTTEAATAPVIAESLAQGARNTGTDLRKEHAALLAEIDAAITNAPAKATDTVTFDVPGDGKFKVANSKPRLEWFRAKIAAAKKGFFPEPKRAAHKTPMQKIEGGKASDETIREMLKDGDLTAALELSKVVGRPLVFGAYDSTEVDAPLTYTDANPFAPTGFESFGLVSARNSTGSMWSVIEPSTGFVIGVGKSRAEIEKSAANELAKTSPQGLSDALKRLKKSGKAKDQAALEAEWVKWAEQAEYNKDHAAENERKARETKESALAADRAKWEELTGEKPDFDPHARNPFDPTDMNPVATLADYEKARKNGKGDEFLDYAESKFDDEIAGHRPVLETIRRIRSGNVGGWQFIGNKGVGGIPRHEKIVRTQDGRDIRATIDEDLSAYGMVREDQVIKEQIGKDGENLTLQQAREQSDRAIDALMKPKDRSVSAPDAAADEEHVIHPQTDEEKRFAEIKAATRTYWYDKAVPALEEYFAAFGAMGNRRLENNRVKPVGLSATDWLVDKIYQQSTWARGRKTGLTGIQSLSQKDLWPTDDGKGERLRKSMLAAMKAIKSAPAYSVDWIRAIETGSGSYGPEALMQPPTDALTAEIPPSVRDRVQHALGRLRDAEHALESVERARGKGHILALEVRDQQDAIKAARATLDEFRKMAPSNNVDADAVIKSMGGEPDFERFGKAAEGAETTPDFSGVEADGSGRTITPDSLNLLRNPVGNGDTILFSNGERWVAKEGWTGGTGAWTLLQGKTQHPTVHGIKGQAEFIRAIIAAEEAAKGQKEPPAWHTALPTEGLPITDDQRKSMGYEKVGHAIAADAYGAITKTQLLANGEMYAYYLPAADGRNGIVRLLPDDQTPSKQWTLLNGEAIRAGMAPEEQVIAKLTNWLRSAPVVGDTSAPKVAEKKPVKPVASKGKPEPGRYVSPSNKDNGAISQRIMADRAGTLSSLTMLNEAVRKTNPDAAYTDSEIANVSTDRIDDVRDWLIANQKAPDSAPQKSATQIIKDVAKARPFDAAKDVRDEAIKAVEDQTGKGVSGHSELSATAMTDPVYQAIHDGQYEGIRAYASSLPVSISESAIPLDLANRAFSGTSMSPERRGASARRGLFRELVDLWRRFEKGYAAATDERKESFVSAFNDIAERYASLTAAYLSSHSRVMSTMITGPSNFPVERQRKLSDAADNNPQEANEYLQKAPARLLKVLRGAVDNSVSAAITEAEAKLAERQSLQLRMKAVNLAHARFVKDPDSLDKADLTDGEKKVIREYKPRYSWEPHPYAPYELTNNGSEIRRLTARVEELKKRASEADSQEDDGEEAQPGESGPVRMVRNATAGRLQLFFDGKPSEDVRTDLKASGFKWAPSVGAWQRQLTDNAIASAEQIIAKHFPTDTAPASNADAGDATRYNVATDTLSSPSDRAIYGMAAEGKSAADILAFISKASRRPFNRYLANALRNIGVSSTITLDSQGGWQFNQSKQGAKYAAAYNPKTDTVALFTARDAERHALHELTHAATLKAISAGGPASVQMRGLFLYLKRNGTLAGQYGISNLDEFVAEAFSNPKFQQALKAIPAPKGSTLKSMWEWFVRAVARILGMKTAAMETALDRAMTIGAQLMRENAGLNGSVDGVRPSFAGESAETAKGLSLRLAQKKIASGSSADSVRQQTGWFKGADDKWRFEINDSDAKLKNLQIEDGEAWTATSLSMVLDHPALFAAYPRLSDLYVQITIGQNKTNEGEYAIGRARTKDQFGDAPEIKVSARTEKQALSTLLHEIQHGIQNIEGFATGGNPDIMQFTNRLNTEFIQRIGEWNDHMLQNGYPFDRLIDTAPEVIRFNDDFADTIADQSEWLMDKSEKESGWENALSEGDIADLQNNILGDGWERKSIVEDGYTTYRKLAGEVEARNVQSRKDMTDEDRRMTAPESTQDVPSSDVIVVFNGKDAMSAPMPDNAQDNTITVDGIERPTTNSNGKPIAQTDDGIQNFWRWFDESKVVDDQGRPLAVYHGTQADFSEFDPQRAGQNFDDSDERGMLFSSKPIEPNLMAERDDGNGGNVVPAYLSLSNPLVVEFDANDARRQFGVVSATSWYDNHKVDILRSADLGDHDGIIIRSPSHMGYRAADTFVALLPEQIKSATGNNGQFSPDNPDIRYNIATDWYKGPNGAPVRNAWQAAKAKAAAVLSPKTLDKIIYELQDKFIDLKRLQANIKAIGGTITDMNDAYLGEELYHKRLAYRTERFEKDELLPLMADLKAKGITTDELETFLHARHAPEANAEMAKRNPNQAEIDAGQIKAARMVRSLELRLQRAKARGLATVAVESALNEARGELANWNGAQAFQGTEAERRSLSGMSDAAAAAIMAALTPERRADLDALAARVDAINAGTLKLLDTYGLMSKESLKEWRDKYRYYIPLHRDEAHPDSISHPIGQGFSTKGDAAKRRTGSNQKVTHILGHIAMQREAALTRGEKNHVMLKLYLMARQNPLPDVWKVGAVPTIDTIDKKTGFVKSIPDPLYKQKPNVLVLRVGGKDVAITINEHNPEALRMAQALKNLDVDDLHYLIPVVGKATRWFAAMNTQYNPIFGLINLMRDTQEAALNLSSTDLAGKQGEIFKDQLSILREVLKNKGRMPKTGPWAALFDEFNRVGGTTGYRDLFLDAEDRGKALQSTLDSIDRGKASQAFHAVADWLSDYNEAMENATRLAAYKAGIDNGMTKERAASLAKNLTVNFNRKGRQTRELGALYAFFNAAVQGTARMAQTLSGPTGRKIMAGGVALGAINAMMGIAMMGGGDDGDDEYEKIPDFVKQRSIIIPTGAHTYISLPMPLGFQFLPNIGRLAVEMAVYKDKTAGKQFVSLFSVLADAFNPLGGNSPAMQMVAPTVMDPFVALAQNKDWTGKPIYIENRNSLDPKPGADRSKDSATPWAKWFSKTINDLTGGTEYTPGGWSPTPDQIDFVIGQLTGGVGREAGKVASTVASPFNGEELPAYKVPLLGRLYGSTEGHSGQSDKFYENITRANEVEGEIKGRMKAGLSPAEYLQDHPGAMALAARGNAAEKQVAALRKMRHAVVKRDAPDAAERAQALNNRIAAVMTRFNREVSLAESRQDLAHP